MMFGDVGGLNDFLALGLSSLFAFIEGPMMLASMVQKLFLFSTVAEHPRPALDDSIETIHP